MTGEGILQQDLVISKLLRQDIDKYRSIFPHVSAAIQLSNNNSNGSSGKYPTKGDTVQHIYTNSQHNNPLCRVVPIENLQEEGKSTLDKYDKEKYREMVLDAAETILGSFGFDRTVYGNYKRKKGRKKWYEELRAETRDIQTEAME
jgi:DNA polymerase elongation subunit (family B)